MSATSRHDRTENDVRRALIDAAQGDGPSPAATRRARSAALAVVGIAASTSAASAVSASAARWLATLKWFGVGVVSGTGLLIATQSLSEPPSQRLVVPSIAATPSTHSEPANLPSLATSAAAAHPSAAPSTSAAAVPVHPQTVDLPSSELAPVPAAVDTSAPVLVTQASLADEVAALDEARKAMERSSPTGALAALDRYAARFPKGRLTHEATFIRIEALVQSGQREAAKSLADQLLANNPDSPLADRIRQLVGR